MAERHGAYWCRVKVDFGLALAVLLLVMGPTPAGAEDPVRARVSNVENRFPDEIAFSVEAESAASDVRSLQLRFTFGGGQVERYGPVEFTPARAVTGKYLMKTGRNNFIPPGATITYWIEAEDAAGNRVRTESRDFWYADTRFEWRSIRDGGITVYYYGNVEANAQRMITAAHETEERVGRMLGTTGRPFTLMLYNSARDIVGAQPPEPSETRSRELIRAGIAYSGEDLVQVLGSGGTGGQGTARHEITHLFVHWTAGNNVPAWLDEGMAVWGQGGSGGSYGSALERAIREDRLLLLRGLDAFPGRSDENILAYGQSASVIKYLVDTGGGDRMREVYVGIRRGDSAAQAVERIYGLTLDELDAAWRQTVGAKPRASYDSVLPTPIPLGSIEPIDAAAPGATPDAQGPPFALAAAGLAALLLATGAGAALRRSRRGW